ncbi:MAG: 4-hydroxy-tetrahydrodipicolinate reductase [Flavobacteriales bacterium]|jgi:4-hydroxy-tetrahydrodipicolinate reductase|nr:4-hydroxy-tetrahydrodipicolinate reductase [Flavobacteriales bacterium]MBT5750395.1 4-hydroxy-tetrahydrodipicolinate reductase [Flavobacteriales bacterium]
MKIAILGNGRMGKRISELAIERGYTIICNSSSEKPATNLNLSNADVAIDFSTPTTAFENISHAINSGIPVVSGTTGWLKNLAEIEALCKTKKGAFLYASNFSLGMNIFFEINKTLAKLMKNQNYGSSLHEIHHTKKLDSPSGTAKILGEQMDNILANSTPISSERIGDIPGKHIINYSSKVDEIEIKHTAKNRDGFAMGAIIAAEWIQNKKGIFNMQDVLAQ